MSLPTVFKSHAFKEQIIAAQGSSASCCYATIIAVKDAMIGAGTWKDLNDAVTTSPSVWVVTGSSNGASAAHDGVDRWTGYGSWSGANQPWICLHSATLGIYLLIAISTSIQTSVYVRIARTPFSGGSASSVPSSATEISVAGVGSPNFGGPGSDIATSLIADVCSDGTTRVFLLRGALVGAWIFDAIGSPSSGWTTPVNVIVHGVGTSGTDIKPLDANEVQPSAFNNAGAQITSQTGEPNRTANNDKIRALVTAANPINGKWPLFGLLMFVTTASNVGVYGHYQDLFFGVDAHATGDCYDDTAATTRRFLKLGALVIPWKGSNPTINPNGAEPSKTIRNAEYAQTIAVADTSPTIENFVAPATALDELRFDVIGTARAIAVALERGTLAEHVYRDFGVGRFFAPYRGSVETIDDGLRFRIWRNGGWPSGRPHIDIEAV